MSQRPHKKIKVKKYESKYKKKSRNDKSLEYKITKQINKKNLEITQNLYENDKNGLKVKKLKRSRKKVN